MGVMGNSVARTVPYFLTTRNMKVTRSNTGANVKSALRKSNNRRPKTVNTPQSSMPDEILSPLMEDYMERKFCRNCHGKIVECEAAHIENAESRKKGYCCFGCEVAYKEVKDWELRRLHDFA